MRMNSFIFSSVQSLSSSPLPQVHFTPNELFRNCMRAAEAAGGETKSCLRRFHQEWMNQYL